MKIIGICSGHDCSYAILENGIPIIHNELERFIRQKEPIDDAVKFLFDTYDDVDDIKHACTFLSNWKGGISQRYPESYQKMESIVSKNGGQWWSPGHHQSHAANARCGSMTSAFLKVTNTSTDRVKFSVTCTPIEQISTEEALSPIPEIIASEVGKSLSGNGEAPVTAYNAAAAVQGYTGGVVNYMNCVDNSATAISTETTASFVFIKNTGFLFDTVTTLGVAMTEHVVVTTVNTGTTVISSLAPGEAIVLKALQATKSLDCTKIQVQNREYTINSLTSSTIVAVTCNRKPITTSYNRPESMPCGMKKELNGTYGECAFDKL